MRIFFPDYLDGVREKHPEDYIDRSIDTFATDVFTQYDSGALMGPAEDDDEDFVADDGNGPMLQFSHLPCDDTTRVAPVGIRPKGSFEKFTKDLLDDLVFRAHAVCHHLCAGAAIVAQGAVDL